METYPLASIAASQLAIATGASTGRSSATLFGGHESALRQTVIALAEGRTMEIHNSPESATLMVISGTLTIASSEAEVDVSSGDLLVVPSEPHTITARQDATALLTVSKGEYPD